MEGLQAGSMIARTAPQPQSIDAERSVLGALMKDYNALVYAMEVLQQDDFYQPQHAAIFRAMRTLYMQPRAVDLITMDEELSRTGMLEGIGGTDYLIDLIRLAPRQCPAPYRHRAGKVDAAQADRCIRGASLCPSRWTPRTSCCAEIHI